MRNAVRVAARSVAVWAGAVSAIGGTTGCTFGKVTDAVTQAPVEGATLTFQPLGATPQVVEPPAPAVLGGGVSLTTWSTAQLIAEGSPTDYAGTYWDDPYTTLPTLPMPPAVTPGWNRVQVTAPNYDPFYTYRNDAYAVGAVTTNVAATSGTNAVVPPLSSLTSITTFENGPTLLSNLNFTMYQAATVITGLCEAFNLPVCPTLNDHPMLPDLIVDVRSLLPAAAGAAVPSPQQIALGKTPAGGEGAPCDPTFPASQLPPTTQECLAFPLSIVNVGVGNFEVISNTAALSSVQQVYYSAGGVQSIVPTTGSLIATAPGGFHVHDLVAMRLRGPIVPGCLSTTPAPGCCDTDATATNCPVAGSSSKAICMDNDSDSTFDNDIQTQFNKHPTAAKLDGLPIESCQAFNTEPNGQLQVNPTTGIIDEGLTPGRAEMYGIGNAFNYLDITNLAPGQYWLEAEVNPADPVTGQRTYTESDTSNNVARATITITPGPGGGL